MKHLTISQAITCARKAANTDGETYYIVYNHDYETYDFVDGFDYDTFYNGDSTIFAAVESGR